MESSKQVFLLFYQKLAILVLECCYQLYTNATGFHINGFHLPHTCQKQFSEILFSPPKVQHRIKTPQYFSPIGTFTFFGLGCWWSQKFQMSDQGGLLNFRPVNAQTTEMQLTIQYPCSVPKLLTGQSSYCNAIQTKKLHYSKPCTKSGLH